MKLRANSYVFIAIMAIMILVIIVSLGMTHLEDMLLPLIVSSSILVIAGIGLGKELRAGRNLGTTGVERETAELKEARENWRLGLLAGLWITGFFFVVWFLGFLIAIPAFVISYMKSHGTRWYVAILYGFVTLAALYGIFELALQIKLYRGLVFTWVG